jgi:hypothetical protein
MQSKKAAEIGLRILYKRAVYGPVRFQNNNKGKMSQTWNKIKSDK